jgi:hypothetical protein
MFNTQSGGILNIIVALIYPTYNKLEVKPPT